MNEILKSLVGKRFSCYFYGEFSGVINFMELIHKIYEYSDFNEYSKSEKLSYFRKSVKEKIFYIDCDRAITFK